MGVTAYGSQGQRQEDTPWKETSAKLATKQSDLSLSEISKLMADGFEPLASPARNVDDDEPDLILYEHIDQLLFFSAKTLRGLVEQQFTYGETESEIHMGGSYDQKAEIIGMLAAEVYLNVAYVAHNTLGATLDDVVAKNMQKLQARIKANRVDKSDGARDESLK